MDETFRFQWRGRHYHGAPVSDLWFALIKEGDGWWFDALIIGRARLTGGAVQAADFARWLLQEPPNRAYENDFLLVDDEPTPGVEITWIPPDQEAPVRVTNTSLTVECLLGREERGGPEYLLIGSVGHAPDQGFSFQICAELIWEPLDRAQLEPTAARILAVGSRF